MTWASGEAVGVLAFLLPGFVAAAVFYSFAIVLAVALAYAVNADTVHCLLRRPGATKGTLDPSERYSAFSRHPGCCVVLHLDGERRLYGRPEESPGRPDEGYFRIVEAGWSVDDKDDKQVPANGVSAVLISASAFEIVEFLPASE